MLLEESIPLHTLHIVGKETLKNIVVWDEMDSIMFYIYHSIHFLQIQTMEHNFIPFHSTIPNKAFNFKL
jgi:hypothetical protein